MDFQQPLSEKASEFADMTQKRRPIGENDSKILPSANSKVIDNNRKVFVAVSFKAQSPIFESSSGGQNSKK